MPNTNLLPHERELRLLNEIKRAIGRLDKGDVTRARSDLQKALNESEGQATKRNRF